MKQITDLDLPPIYRTQANYYRAQYYQARTELVKANKGLRKLRRRLDNKPLEEEFMEDLALIMRIGSAICEECGPNRDCELEYNNCSRIQDALKILERYKKKVYGVTLPGGLILREAWRVPI